MAKKLSDYLRSIGLEVHDPIYCDDKGNIRPITKDEVLARAIFDRALGYETEVTNADGSVSHRVFQPDPKAQSFIFERREGKIVIPVEDNNAPALVDKMRDIVKREINTVAQELARGNSTDDNTQDPEDTVS